MDKQFKDITMYFGLFTMVVLSVIACGNTSMSNSKMGSTNMPIENMMEAEAVQVPDVSFVDENGKTVSVESLKGKVVFINFWATWCPPCIRELPSINKLKQTFKDHDNIMFLMVDMDGNMKGAKSFMKRRKFDLPVYIPASDIPVDYYGGAIPTTIILDKRGEMIARIEGERDYSSPGLVKAMKDLLAID